MTRERLVLLTLLGIVSLNFMIFIGYIPLRNEADRLKERQKLNERTIAKLTKSIEEKKSQDQNIQESVSILYSRYLNPTVEDEHLYEFGQRIKESLLSYGLKINRYQETSGSAQKAWEYTLEGSPLQILNFLASLKKEKTFIDISHFTINGERSPASMTLVIAPAILSEDIEEPPELLVPKEQVFKEYDIQPARIQEVFYKTKIIVQKVPSPIPVPVKEEKKIVRNKIFFIGTVMDVDGTQKLFFKDSSEDEVFSLTKKSIGNEDWLFLSETTQYYLISKNGVTYEVNK